MISLKATGRHAQEQLTAGKGKDDDRFRVHSDDVMGGVGWLREKLLAVCVRRGEQ